ncbi:MAG: hypothetical protein RI974_714 [Actinomycetota bacterium]
MRNSLKIVLVVLVGLIALGGALSANPGSKVNSTSKALDGACSTGTPGVTLVIERADAAPAITCTPNFTGSGWELLDGAHDVQGTLNYPTGFACRIDGYPTSATQDCADTPTYAEGFSGAGSAMRKPACGTSEAWVFSGSNQPEATKPTTQPTVFECSN